ncbi:MAG: hypothetical protein ABI367_09090 [Mucilaginibacter sp.]
MKKSTKVIAAILLSMFVLWKCTPKQSSKSQLPQDVLASCTLSADSFKTWFADKNVTLNGVVTPANSVAFPTNNTNCDFYQWAERMFLWVTSPVNGGPVLASKEFYSVTPPDSAGNRTLIAHTVGSPIQMSAHIAKLGPNRLPVIKAKNGKLLEIETTNPKAKKLVTDGTGKIAEVKSVVKTGTTFAFLDNAGKAISNPHAIIQHKKNPRHFVQRFTMGKKEVFLDSDGNVVDSEEGQATGDALRAQNGSLVYYLTLVNDVYAEYLNLANEVPAFRKKFPTTKAERDAIVLYATAHKRSLPDANALAMEVKSSWVEASTLPDSSNYVLMTATIPTYDTTKTTVWIPNGTKTVRMAMVGIHIAGSVAGHPEMIWSTFEHQNNTPNAAYSYLNTNKDTIRVPQDGGTGWLFTANAADTGANVSHIVSYDVLNTANPSGSTDTLFSNNKFPISPSNTLRTQPWGSQSPAGAPSNQNDKTSAASNSEILSINNSIHGMLSTGDVRANYLLIGATWTPGGTAPSGNSYSGVDTAGVAIGTSVLANSTMETYFQSPVQSCFTCHSTATGIPTLSPDTISHVFQAIQPFAVVLKPATKKGKK